MRVALAVAIGMAATLGNQLSYADRFPNGPFRIDSDNGAFLECLYVDGERHGPYREAEPGGRVIVEGEFWHGMRSGTWTERKGEYWESQEYLLGMAHGLFERWIEVNGEKQVVAFRHYVLGRRHGEALMHNEERTKTARGHYRGGKRHGTWVVRREGSAPRSYAFECGEPLDDGLRPHAQNCSLGTVRLELSDEALIDEAVDLLSFVCDSDFRAQRKLGFRVLVNRRQLICGKGGVRLSNEPVDRSLNWGRRW